MASRKILAEHPSVQDLAVHMSGVNHRKVAYNNVAINAGPLTNPSNPRNAKKEAKGQTTTVLRHEQNLINAANRPRSNVNVGSKKPPLAPANLNKPQTPVLLASALKKLHSGSQSGSKCSSKASSLKKKSSSLTADKLPALGRKAPSIVTSVESFDGTDAESYTEYSCSCCAIRPPSSVPTGRALSHVPSGVASSHGNYTDSVLDAYDNMTSISQRIAAAKGGQPNSTGAKRHHHHSKQASSIGGTSVASTKLRELESQLAKEREDRQKTQDDLKIIQDRQILLMSKLSDREREKFDEALQK